MFAIRKLYYKTLGRISEVPLVPNATGSGLFDRAVLDILRQLRDPYPYFRGQVCEIGCPIATVPFRQPRRLRGVTSHSFYSLYDMAMLGITRHSKVPLRLMTLSGFALACVSLLVAATGIASLRMDMRDLGVNAVASTEWLDCFKKRGFARRRAIGAGRVIGGVSQPWWHRMTSTGNSRQKGLTIPGRPK